MDKQYIRFVERTPMPSVIENKNYYQVRADKPLVWVQRACCWVLNKLGAYSQDHTIAYAHRTVDVSNLVEGIYAQLGMLHSDYNIRGKRVLIGSEDFANLCNAAEAQYHLTVYASSRQFGGLTVTVIPWMKGILVMPE